jgi:hypothetical protein
VPDPEERFKIADTFGDKARDVQFDALMALKDKRKLIALMSKFAPNSANYLKAQALLSNAVRYYQPIKTIKSMFRHKSGKTDTRTNEDFEILSHFYVSLLVMLNTFNLNCFLCIKLVRTSYHFTDRALKGVSGKERRCGDCQTHLYSRLNQE